MANDVGAQLVQAGLITRNQLAEVLGRAPPHEGALIVGLAHDGVIEDALAGFFVARGYGPLLDAEDLARAEASATSRLDGSIARQLYALPVRATAAGLVVAMVAPTDTFAVRELSRAVRGEILPTVARVGDLRAALHAFYPLSTGPSEEPGPPRTPPPVLELRTPKGRERPSLGPQVLASADETFVPLVRHKPVSKPPSHAPAMGLPSSVEPPERTPTSKMHAIASEPTRPATKPPPPPGPKAIKVLRPPRRSGEQTNPEGRWESSRPPPADRPTRRPSRSTPASRPPQSIGAAISGIRNSRSRDEIVQLACKAARSVCRVAVLFALKGHVLRGWQGAGLSTDAAKNLFIPTQVESRFHAVVAKQQSFFGPPGTATADQLFRAAVSSRGGEIALLPIVVGARLVAVLAADAVEYGEIGRERLETIARVVGEALERLIVASKQS